MASEMSPASSPSTSATMLSPASTSNVRPKQSISVSPQTRSQISSMAWRSRGPAVAHDERRRLLVRPCALARHGDTRLGQRQVLAVDRASVVRIRQLMLPESDIDPRRPPVILDVPFATGLPTATPMPLEAATARDGARGRPAQALPGTRLSSETVPERGGRLVGVDDVDVGAAAPLEAGLVRRAQDDLDVPVEAAGRPPAGRRTARRARRC